MGLFHRLPGPPSPIAALLTAQMRSFLLALGFLTRLAPPLAVNPADISRAVLYYPAAGGVLGLILVLPPALGLFASSPAVQSWLYLLLSAWLTRALHLDGLADVLDALGSGKHGQAFHDVLKDSRIGAFGVTGLLLALGGQAVLLYELLKIGAIAPLFFAPVYGRCLPCLLAAIAPVHPKATLGALLAAAPLKTALFQAAICVAVAGLVCLSPARLALCLLFTLPALLLLFRLAQREGGYNGDFLGCLILAGEISALLAAFV